MPPRATYSAMLADVSKNTDILFRTYGFTAIEANKLCTADQLSEIQEAEQKLAKVMSKTIQSLRAR